MVVSNQTFPLEINSERLLFRSYTIMSKACLVDILMYRNSREVSKWMSGTVEISKEEHFSFVERLRGYSDRVYYGVYKKSKLIGGVNLCDVNHLQKTATWGIFLKPEMIGSGVGLEVEFEFLKILFNEFKMNRISGAVHQSNKDSLQIQAMFNFNDFKENDNFTEMSLKKEAWAILPQNFTTFKKSILRWKKN
jgi:UDP-4-amino-4,6-dideoxy-N-acetyl-beta-L-altrosamine N-acetyltransferase